jgi:hypothetical protein
LEEVDDQEAPEDYRKKQDGPRRKLLRAGDKKLEIYAEIQRDEAHLM